MLAPICLFTYNRVEELKQTIKALQRNYLATESELYIFSDGPKDEKDSSKILEVRKIIQTISGFRIINVFQSDVNRGLAKSVISGITRIFRFHDKVIVLEDDLITSPNFLDFMNQALDFYKSVSKIFSISGYTNDLRSLSKQNKDFYLAWRQSSWGWATWKDRWNAVDWELKDFKKFKYNYLQQIKFMRGGSDLPGLLKKQRKGKIDSWAIRWHYTQFKVNQVTVYPKSSKVTNIGIGQNSTHTKRGKRFDTPLDQGIQRNFQFDLDVKLNKNLIKEFKSVYSIKNRIISRLKNE